MTDTNDSAQTKLFKRNYKLMMSESALFWFASAFVDANNVVSVFIHEYTGSLQLAGLSAVVRTVSFLAAQFIAGFLLLGVSNRARVMHRVSIFTRCTIFLMIPALLIGIPGNAAAWMLIVCLAVFCVGDGFVGLVWMGISARTIPNNMRGQMIGNAQMLAGVLSLAAGFMIRTVMGGNLPPSAKYSLIFGFCGLFYLANMLVLNQIKDREDMPYPITEQPSLKMYFNQFKHILCDMPRPRFVIISRAVYTLSLMAAPLTILFGQSHLGLPKEITSSMIYVQMIGVLCGGFTWGRLSRYFSTSLVMIGSMAMAAVIGGLGIISFLIGGGPVAQWIFYFMVFFVGFNQSSWIGFSNEIIRLSSDEDRTTMFVLLAMIQIPASFGPYFAGLLAEKVSFLPVFASVLGCGVLGLLMTASLFRERNNS